MTVVYADASALVKLLADEQHSKELRRYLADADLLSSELSLAEVPRALRRRPPPDEALLEARLERARELLGGVAMHPLKALLLEVAGAFEEPSLRALDAVHVATALCLQPLDAFVTYDVRQAASARLAGLRTVSPGF